MEESDYLPLSAIQHYFFCPRQFALIHIEKQWKENVLTAEGRVLHDRVDNYKYIERKEGYVIERSVSLRSARLGICGVADVVEYAPDREGVNLPSESGMWRPRPVEYKRGKPKTGICDMAQLCAQAICLEETHGIKVESGDLFYWQTRRRLPVVFDDNLRQAVANACTEMQRLISAGITPVVPDSAQCKNCSMNDLCLPKLARKKRIKVSVYLKTVFEQEQHAQTT